MALVCISFSQLGIQLVSESIHFHESCHSFESLKDCIVCCCIVFYLIKSMLPSLRSSALCSKGKLFWEFTPVVKTTFLSQLLLSKSYGYIILKIPKFCSEFCVIDVGSIMGLLRWDYYCWLQLIIKELVLETSLVPWDLYALMIDSLAFDIGSHHWPFIKRFDWVFDIKTSIHT